MKHEPYIAFAKVYDWLMEWADYDIWTRYLLEIWRREDFFPETVLDLGCGTGNIAVRLLRHGIQVTGVDKSSAMLSQAERKAREAGLALPLYAMDARRLRGLGPFDGVISLCDTLSYVLSYWELCGVFRRVWHGLKPDGLFVFDLNTPYKLAHVLGNHVFARTDRELSYIWQSSFDPETRLCRYDIAFFHLQPNGFYRRFREVHLQYAHDPEKVVRALARTGFRLKGMWSDLTFDPPHPSSQRITFLAQKCLKG